MPSSSSWPLVELSPVPLLLFCTDELRTGSSTPSVASPVLSIEDSPPLIFWQHFQCSSAACSLCSKSLLPVHVQLGVQWDPQAFFCQASFELVRPQHIRVPGVAALCVQDFQCPLLTCMQDMQNMYKSQFPLVLVPLDCNLDLKLKAWQRRQVSGYVSKVKGLESPHYSVLFGGPIFPCFIPHFI